MPEISYLLISHVVQSNRFHTGAFTTIRKRTFDRYYNRWIEQWHSCYKKWTEEKTFDECAVFQANHSQRETYQNSSFKKGIRERELEIFSSIKILKNISCLGGIMVGRFIFSVTSTRTVCFSPRLHSIHKMPRHNKSPSLEFGPLHEDF